MRIVYNKVIPFKKFEAVNLFGILFARKEYIVSKRTIHHEQIHTIQMKEMLYVFFYLWYIIEWLLLLFKYRNATKAYFNIRFEQEAYKHETDFDYLKKRKPFAWI